MKWKTWLKRSGSKRTSNRGWTATTGPGERAFRTARANGKSLKQSKLIAFKIDNFSRAKLAKYLKKNRKKYSSK